MRAQPVVALESTIISHGMPYPQNVETARSVEAIIRTKGAIPATIAILDGVIRVGSSSSAVVCPYSSVQDSARRTWTNLVGLAAR